MKVVIVGPSDWSAWYPVEQVLAALGPDDIIVHDGSYSLGGKIDRIVKRTNRARRPKVEVQFPEVPRYSPEVALEKNAIQLVGFHRPQAVIWFGDSGEEPEVSPVLRLAATYGIPAQPWDEFVAARTRR